MLIQKNIHVDCPWIIKNIEPHGSFKGYASVFYELDDQNDRVLPGAFAETVKQWKNCQKAPKMLWQHNQAEPIGWWKSIREDQQGLYVEGQLLLSIQKAREIYEMLKNSMIDGLSIGCRILDAEHSTNGGERLLKSLDLFEISLVTFAANNKARIQAIKSGAHVNSSKLSAGDLSADTTHSTTHSTMLSTSQHILKALRRTQQILRGHSG